MPDVSLFNIPVNRVEIPPSTPPGEKPKPPQGPQEVGVVTSAQGTITFAVAPAAVTIVWKVLSNASPAVAGWTWFPVVLSLVVGMAIYYLAPASGTARQKGIAFFFALINSFAIAATTLGIDTVIKKPEAKGTSQSQGAAAPPVPLSVPIPAPVASK